MVCPRCVMAVEQILDRLQLPYQSVSIGMAELEGELNEQAHQALNKALQEIGFEILQDRKEMLVEEVKLALQELLNSGTEQAVKTSVFLSNRFHLDYAYLSSIFSELHGESLEKYLIGLKVEKIKEYLQYDQPLAEIAHKLNYSSIAHLSSQFKKVTGQSPSEFRKSR